MSLHQQWLEAPYQQAEAEAERYESFCDAHEDEVRAELRANPDDIMREEVSEYVSQNLQFRGWAEAAFMSGPRHFDDGLTLEVNRACTDGTENANSMLYGAIWRAAKAMGYLRCITYTQADESGASLRAVGWVREREIPVRKSWAESSVALKEKRDPVGNGGVARVLWSISCGQAGDA